MREEERASLYKVLGNPVPDDDESHPVQTWQTASIETMDNDAATLLSTVLAGQADSGGTTQTFTIETIDNDIAVSAGGLFS